MFRSEAMRRLARLMHVAAAMRTGAALGLEMHSAWSMKLKSRRGLGGSFYV